MVEKRLEFWPERSPVRPIAFVTMARDEEIFLKAWICNGLRINPDADFYILDHASTVPLSVALEDFCSEWKGQINFIRIPAIPFDDDYKAMALSGLAKTLIHSHAVVVSSDCDELLVGLGIHSTAVYPKLLEIAHFCAPIGFEIVQHPHAEKQFDPLVPVTEQRNFGFFAAGYTKPVVWRGRTEFGAGLHRIRDDFAYESTLALLHLRSVDTQISASRATLRRQYDLSESQLKNGRDAHWRRPIEQKIDLHQKLLASPVIESASVVLPQFLDELKNKHSINGGGFWGHDIKSVSGFCSLDGILG